MAYDDNFVRGLEYLWGDGFLSPGGPEEFLQILKGIAVAGKVVLDIGCGLGGFDRLLVEEHRAQKVTAIDVVDYLIDRARQDANSAGLNDRIEYHLVSPGPLLFQDAQFDIVFSKDAIVHVEDKFSMYQDIYRVLKPGGVFAGSDWLGSDATNESELVQDWLEYSGLEFYFRTADQISEILRSIGFESVTARDRNQWYRRAVREEIAKVTGESGERFCRLFGPESAAFRLESSSRKLKVADAGELRPTLLRAQKPPVSA